MTEEEVLTLLLKHGCTEISDYDPSPEIIDSLVEKELVRVRTIKKYRAVNSNTRTWDIVKECMLTNAGVKRAQSSQT